MTGRRKAGTKAGTQDKTSRGHKQWRDRNRSAQAFVYKYDHSRLRRVPHENVELHRRGSVVRQVAYTTAAAASAVGRREASSCSGLTPINYCCRAETKNVFSRPFSLRCVNKRSDHYYYCCSGHKPDDKNKHNSCHGSFDRLPAAKSSTETSRQNRRQRGRIKSSHVKSCHQPSTRLATSVASPKEPASTAIRPPGDDKKKNAKTTATQLWCKPTLLSYGRAIYPQVVLQVAFLGPQTGSQGVGQLPEQHRRLHQT